MFTQPDRLVWRIAMYLPCLVSDQTLVSRTFGNAVRLRIEHIQAMISLVTYSHLHLATSSTAILISVSAKKIFISSSMPGSMSLPTSAHTVQSRQLKSQDSCLSIASRQTSHDSFLSKTLLGRCSSSS